MAQGLLKQMFVPKTKTNLTTFAVVSL